VVDVSAAIVLHNFAYIFGDGAEVLDKIFWRFFAQLGVFFDGSVEIGDVSLMVLVVMELHGRFVDVGLESGVVIGQRGKFVSHCISPVVRFVPAVVV
jgi:hypothetical protein